MILNQVLLVFFKVIVYICTIKLTQSFGNRQIKRMQNEANRLFTLKKRHKMASKAFLSAITEANHEIEFINFELGRMGREDGNKPIRKAALLKILEIIDMYNSEDYERIVSLGKAGEEYRIENQKALQTETELDHTKGVVKGLIETMLISAQRFSDKSLLHKAVAIMGHNEVIKIKLKMGLPLWDTDNKFIMENL